MHTIYSGGILEMCLVLQQARGLSDEISLSQENAPCLLQPFQIRTSIVM